MSTLSAAIDVVHAMSERRKGRDPSAQEDHAVAAEYVQASAYELEDQALALRASLVAGSDDGHEAVRLSRRMHEVLILNHLARHLHMIHQRLLSLYPGVPEDLIEDARLLAAACASLRDRIEDGSGESAGVPADVGEVPDSTSDPSPESAILRTLADIDRFRTALLHAVGPRSAR